MDFAVQLPHHSLCIPSPFCQLVHLTGHTFHCDKSKVGICSEICKSLIISTTFLQKFSSIFCRKSTSQSDLCRKLVKNYAYQSKTSRNFRRIIYVKSYANTICMHRARVDYCRIRYWFLLRLIYEKMISYLNTYGVYGSYIFCTPCRI